MRHHSRLGTRLALAVLLLLAACGSADLLGPSAPQGIDGLVLLGPQCPVQGPGNACPDLPYQAWIDVRSSGGGSVTRIRSGKTDGSVSGCGQIDMCVSFDTGIR